VTQNSCKKKTEGYIVYMLIN